MNLNCLQRFAGCWILFIPLVIRTFPALATCATESQLVIERVDPTPLFPRVEPGQPLRQRALLHLNNPGSPLAATARITVGTSPAYTQELGDVPAGKSVKPIAITDIPAPAKVTIQLLSKDGGRLLATHELTWQPQKKWKIYCVSYSHQDLGYGDYPHRLRTDNRHGNIELALRHCDRDRQLG